MALHAFVDLPDGLAVRVGAEGLLLGRHRSCDIQVADEAASRRHALLRVGHDGVELVVLGKKPVHVNDQACTTVQLLRDGDRVRLPGFECRVRVQVVEESVRIDHVLRRGAGSAIQIHATPFVVGSGATARVVVEGWPAEALVFRIAQGVLHVEVTTGEALLDGVPLAESTPAPLAVGSVLTYRNETFVIEQASGGDASTMGGGVPGLATAIVLHPLPRGGRITLAFADGERSVYLPGRRFRLVAALATPPAPHVAGDYIPDAAIIPVVWHDDDEVGGRQDINVVMTRCRQDLVAAGIAATTLLQRAPGGRATRILLAPGAQVTTATD